MSSHRRTSDPSVTMNVSQKRDPRMWRRLRELHLIGGMPVHDTAEVESVDTSGDAEESRAWTLASDNRSGRQIILVWHESQRVPATAYGEANLSKQGYSIEVCKDPNVRLRELGEERAFIYHFSG